MATFPLTAAQVGLLPGLVGMATWSNGVVGYDHVNLTVSDALGAIIAPIIASPGWDTAPAADQAKASLVAYANTKADGLIAAMTIYGSSPILKADRTANTVSDLLAIVQDAATNPTDIYNWVANDDTVTALTASQIAALAPTVAGDRKAIYAALAATILAINSGTITTTAQIDAEAWPT